MECVRARVRCMHVQMAKALLTRILTLTLTPTLALALSLALAHVIREMLGN